MNDRMTEQEEDTFFLLFVKQKRMDVANLPVFVPANPAPTLPIKITKAYSYSLYLKFLRKDFRKTHTISRQRSGKSRFEATPGKKLVKSHFNQQARILL
jgi:hypothetical protein